MKNISTNILITIIVILIIVSGGLFFYSRTISKDNARKDFAIKAATDTLHSFKTKFNSQGGYISQIVADKNSLISLLSIKGKENQELINLLDSDKHVQSATIVKTETKYKYISLVDTTFKGISFTKTIQDDKWITEVIKVDSDILSRDLTYRDGYLFHTDKKPNKGLFSGSTLTTYVEPLNPNTTVTGLTSVTLVVEKRKPRLGIFLGPSISIDNSKIIKPGISLGIGITF